MSSGLQRVETGEQGGLEPYVQTLGVQPMISLSLETNMALPVCSLFLSTGLTVGCVREAYGRGVFCLVCSRFSWWLSQSKSVKRLAFGSFLRASTNMSDHLTRGQTSDVPRFKKWISLDTWMGFRHQTLLYQPFVGGGEYYTDSTMCIFRSIQYAHRTVKSWE